ncbi:MAG: ArsI/CadI family heavy metal resistance metalloenzyme [Pseudomonadota bacterium]
MKRLHIHIKTQDLEKSIGFYSAMFGKTPDKQEPDYAKWLLDDPAANIALSTHSESTGIAHVGVSFDENEDLECVAERLSAHNADLFEEKETTCCYAKSNKYWVRDPQGASWELFQTFGESEHYGAEPEIAAAAQNDSACCEPA